MPEITFIKLPSIKNHTEGSSINKWCQAFPAIATSKFILTEKLDGASFQIIITKDEVAYARRGGLLESDEGLYGWQTVIPKYEEQIGVLQAYVADESNDVEIIRVYGELFGKGIMGRVNYGDEKFFLPFELRINEKVAPIKSAHVFFSSLGIEDWWVPTVTFTDNLEDALSYAVEGVPSTFSEDPEAMHEGVVIAPYEEVFTINDGAIFRVKLKTKAFNDKMGTKTKVRKVFKGSDEYCRLREIWDGYFNENRLLDLFSKHGEIQEKAEFGKFIKLMIEDVREEFFENHKEAFVALPDDEKKVLMSSGGRNTVPLLEAKL
jgi:hypothetical protein